MLEEVVSLVLNKHKKFCYYMSNKLEFNLSDYENSFYIADLTSSSFNLDEACAYAQFKPVLLYVTEDYVNSSVEYVSETLDDSLSKIVQSIFDKSNYGLLAVFKLDLDKVTNENYIKESARCIAQLDSSESDVHSVSFINFSYLFDAYVFAR